MRNSNRRGMLLLVVLAMLAMFALLAVAFVVFASVDKSSAIRYSQIEQTRDPGDKQLNAAALTVVNGSNSPNSAIRSWGLLEKKLGASLYNGTCGATDMQPVLGGQLLTLTLTGASSLDAMHAVGCTVTMITGQFAGQSTLIVGLQPVASGVPTIAYLLAFPGSNVNAVPPVVPHVNDQYIINGFPYSGTGFGYNQATGKLDLAFNPTSGTTRTYAAGDIPLAYLPNNPANVNGPSGGATRTTPRPTSKTR